MQNLKDVKFGRNYRAEFEIGERGENGVFIPKDFLEIKYPVTCNLLLDLGVYSTANTGVFQFYNLPRQVQSQLWIDDYELGKKYVKMKFYAGYGDVMPLCFEGIFLTCQSYRESGSVDWVTEIQAFEGGGLLKYGYINATIAKDTQLVDILDYMTEKYDVKPGYITPDIPPLPRNRTFIGQTMDLLNREYGGYDIFIEKGELNILGPNDVVPGDIQVISAETGLLGSPRRANLYTEVETIFEPRLRTKQAINLYSNLMPEFNNLYEVVRIVHKGIISPVISGKLITSATLSLFPSGQSNVLQRPVPTTYGGQPTTGKWDKPCEGRITSPYGYRKPFMTDNGKMSSSNHKGIDIGAPTNAKVIAPANGKVQLAGWLDGYGNCIIVDHGIINGKQVTSLYGHLNKILMGSGQVFKGQEIGLVGATGNARGPHLHFEVMENGEQVNPIQYIGNY